MRFCQKHDEVLKSIIFFIFVATKDIKMKTRTYTTQFLTFTASPAAIKVFIDRCIAGFLKL
jgi:hypothetical protein